MLAISRGDTTVPSCKTRVQSYVLKSNILYRMVWRNRRRVFLLVILQTLEKMLLKTSHDDSGYQGLTRTYASTQDNYNRSNAIIDVVEYWASCQSCRTHKNLNIPPGAFLQRITVGGPFETIGMDFMPLPASVINTSFWQ